LLALWLMPNVGVLDRLELVSDFDIHASWHSVVHRVAIIAAHEGSLGQRNSTANQ